MEIPVIPWQEFLEAFHKRRPATLDLWLRPGYLPTKESF